MKSKTDKLYRGRVLGYGSRHGPLARGKPFARGNPGRIVK